MQTDVHVSEQLCDWEVELKVIKVHLIWKLIILYSEVKLLWLQASLSNCYRKEQPCVLKCVCGHFRNYCCTHMTGFDICLVVMVNSSPAALSAASLGFPLS